MTTNLDRPARLFLLTTTALLAGAPASGRAQGVTDAILALEERRMLQTSDSLLFDGTFDRPYHAYTVDIEPDRLFEVILSSAAFDAFLRVRAESGAEFTNDDGPRGGDGLDSRLQLIGGRDTDGDGIVTYTIQATTLNPGQLGEYTVRVVLGAVGLRHVSERFTMDSVSLKNEPYRRVSLFIEEPSRVIATVSAGQPLPRITGRWPGVPYDEHLEHPGTGEFVNVQGQLDLFVLGSPGSGPRSFQLTVHSFPTNEAGSEPPVTGTLGEEGDQLQPGGEFFDVAVESIELPAGETLAIWLESEDFDPMLIVTAPELGRRWVNDDFDGFDSHLVIGDAVWTEIGDTDVESVQLRVFVTSARAGGVGAWVVRMRRGGVLLGG